MPALPDTDGEEEEEEGAAGGRGRIGELEGIRLIDTLHLGGYWPVKEGAGQGREGAGGGHRQGSEWRTRGATGSRTCQES